VDTAGQPPKVPQIEDNGLGKKANQLHQMLDKLPRRAILAKKHTPAGAITATRTSVSATTSTDLGATVNRRAFAKGPPRPDPGT
jgi:hypothetical protein